jgi:hypothetical protein
MVSTCGYKSGLWTQTSVSKKKRRHKLYTVIKRENKFWKKILGAEGTRFAAHLYAAPKGWVVCQALLCCLGWGWIEATTSIQQTNEWENVGQLPKSVPTWKTSFREWVGYLSKDWSLHPHVPMRTLPRPSWGGLGEDMVASVQDQITRCKANLLIALPTVDKYLPIFPSIGSLALEVVWSPRFAGENPLRAWSKHVYRKKRSGDLEVSFSQSPWLCWPEEGRCLERSP